MTRTVPFDAVAHLPAPGDNAAIATARLAHGARLALAGGELQLAGDVLEGHRFAVRPVVQGEALLSWGMPFGYATRDLAPGEVLCNLRTLQALRERDVDVALPDAENFRDPSEPFTLDRFPLAPAPALPPADRPLAFDGYRREGGRGVGTRNAVALIGVSSLAASYVRALEARLAPLAAEAALDGGIRAVAHTEGGSLLRPNNAELLLRTLAGFAVHPNVGAALLVEGGSEAIGAAAVERALHERGAPIDALPHATLTLSGDLERDLDRGEAQVRAWIERVAAARRSRVAASELKVALQCGGSDAFSGVSGNPLAAWVAMQLIRAGGAANLAETDELIGAEAYVLRRVRDEVTATRFLATVARFRGWAARHGVSPEGNPSGGNRFRGLYNIALKSLGAAMKRAPEVRLDHVIDYAQTLPGSGFTFMDSPGNDLESIAGQVASGANLIFFVTGNGSITNFPFVPTLKFVTTTPRFELLQSEMDVNAGELLDGEPLDAVGAKALDLTLEVASGRRSAGERAGHAQVQIWRDWPLAAPDGASDPKRPAAAASGLGDERSGAPLASAAATPAPTAATGGSRPAPLALVLPTSLCSGQIGLRAAERLNRRIAGGASRYGRAVSLFHTEGCGAAGGDSERLFIRTLIGYALHPRVGACLFLEHGCEKTHNDFLRARLREAGVDPARFGWASIQRDGGIEATLERIERWFTAREADAAVGASAGGPLRLGLVAEPGIDEGLLRAFADAARAVVAAGGTVVMPQGALLDAPAFAQRLQLVDPTPSLAYAQRALRPGLHVMEAPTAHAVETLAGLGATGVELIAAAVAGPRQAHPLVPVVQVGVGAEAPDLDLVLRGESAAWSERLLTLLDEAATGALTPALLARGYTDFQITRGSLGISV
jgi:altronate dehydratase